MLTVVTKEEKRQLVTLAQNIANIKSNPLTLQ